MGVLPNLRAIIDNQLNVTPDVYVRDNVADTGDSHLGAISAVAGRDPAAGAGRQSAGRVRPGQRHREQRTLGFEAEAGQDNFIYVRVRNQGATAAANITATVYWSPLSTLVTPDLWTLVGSTTIPTVPTGEVLTVSDAILWPSAQIPATGHYCLVALIGHGRIRRRRRRTSSTGTTSAVHPGEQQRDLAQLQRRQQCPAPGGRSAELRAAAVHGGGRARQGAAHVLRGRRTAAEGCPRAPGNAARVRRPAAGAVRAGARGGEEPRSCPCPAQSVGPDHVRRRGVSGQGADPDAASVRLPKELQKHAFEIAARQLYEGEEVGRVTWRLAPARREA